MQRAYPGHFHSPSGRWDIPHTPSLQQMLVMSLVPSSVPGNGGHSCAYDTEMSALQWKNRVGRPTVLCEQERGCEGQSPGKGQGQGGEGPWRWVGSVGDFHIGTQRMGKGRAHVQPHRAILQCHPSNPPIAAPQGLSALQALVARISSLPKVPSPRLPRSHADSKLQAGWGSSLGNGCGRPEELAEEACLGPGETTQ